MNVQQTKTTGHMPAEMQGMKKKEMKTGKTEATTEEMMGTAKPQEKKTVKLCGITFMESDLELKDFVCTLKMNDKRTLLPICVCACVWLLVCSSPPFYHPHSEGLHNVMTFFGFLA